jgi:hypothetical protein
MNEYVHIRSHRCIAELPSVVTAQVYPQFLDGLPEIRQSGEAG